MIRVILVMGVLVGLWGCKAGDGVSKRKDMEKAEVPVQAFEGVCQMAKAGPVLLTDLGDYDLVGLDSGAVDGYLGKRVRVFGRKERVAGDNKGLKNASGEWSAGRVGPWEAIRVVRIELQ